MTPSSLAQEIAKAISLMEGFNKPGSVSQRNNNPGNLRSWGMNPILDGYAKFATPEDGWRALHTQVTKNIGRGLTLKEFFAGQRDDQGRVLPHGYPGYAPGADNNHPVEYAKFVAGKVGIVNIEIPINKMGV